MVFVNWENSRACFAMSVDWYEVNKLLQRLNELKQELNGYNFGRDNTFKKYGIKIQKLYDEYTRYPNTGKYYCDAAGKLERLAAFNSIYDTALSKKVYKKRLELYKLVLEIFKDIVQGSCVFDRKPFELWSGVEWDQ